MKIREVRIRNFRNFGANARPVSFVDPLTQQVRPLSVLVGSNGCGKTTLVREIVARALDDKRWVAYIDTARTLAPADWATLATTERNTWASMSSSWIGL